MSLVASVPSVYIVRRPKAHAQSTCHCWCMVCALGWVDCLKQHINHVTMQYYHKGSRKSAVVASTIGPGGSKSFGVLHHEAKARFAICQRRLPAGQRARGIAVYPRFGCCFWSAPIPSNPTFCFRARLREPTKIAHAGARASQGQEGGGGGLCFDRSPIKECQKQINK